MNSSLMPKAVGMPFQNVKYPDLVLGVSRYFASLYLFYEILPIVFPAEWGIEGWKLNLASLLISFGFHKAIDLVVWALFHTQEQFEKFRNSVSFFMMMALNVIIVMAMIFTDSVPPGDQQVGSPLFLTMIVPFVLYGACMLNLAMTALLRAKPNEIAPGRRPAGKLGRLVFKGLVGIVWLASFIPLIVVAIIQLQKFFRS